jgi:hypothetical protein
MIKKKYILMIVGGFAIAFSINAYAMMGGGNHSGNSSGSNSQGYHMDSDNYNQEYHMNDNNIRPGRGNKKYQENEPNGRSGGGGNQGFHRNNDMESEEYHQKDAMDNENKGFNYYNNENND